MKIEGARSADPDPLVRHGSGSGSTPKCHGSGTLSCGKSWRSPGTHVKPSKTWKWVRTWKMRNTESNHR